MVSVGLNNDSDNPFPDAVDPLAKYQCRAVREAHGAWLNPNGPLTTSVTPTPPPVKKTVDAIVDPPGPAVVPAVLPVAVAGAVAPAAVVVVVAGVAGAVGVGGVGATASWLR